MTGLLTRATAVLAGMLAVVALATTAWAADPVFPPGSRLGLVPPSGMVRSRSFEGFEDVDRNAGIIIAALPAVAYAQLDQTMVPEALQKQGIAIDKREPFVAAAGKGFLLSGTQGTGKERFRKWLLIAAVADLTALVTVQIPEQDRTYSDQAVRDALATLAVRTDVPDAERLSLLPFAVNDLAGFKIDDVAPGRALMLIDAPADKGAPIPAAAGTAHVLIAVMPGGPEDPADHDRFARLTFEQIGGIVDVHVQDAEPLRIANQPGYQILARAKEGATGRDVMVVQWLRFGSGGYMQIIGVASVDAWPEAYMRMRTVRDSIDQR